MAKTQVTISYGVEHAGAQVRLYASLLSGLPVAIPMSVENSEKWAMQSDGFVEVGSGFLDVTGRITFQWEENNHMAGRIQAAVSVFNSWRLSSPLDYNGEVIPQQTVEVEFLEVNSSSSGDQIVTEQIAVVVTTSDGMPLVNEISVDVTDDLSGTASNVTQYTISSPQTLVFPADFNSGEQQFALWTNLGSNEPTGTIGLILENISGSSATIGDNSAHTVSIEQVFD